jgi:hypothetical protein
VKIQFQIKDAPAFPIEDNHYLARISESGDVKTSSDIEYGWAKDEYFYYRNDTRLPLKHTTWGGGGLIWGGFNGEESNSDKEVVQRYLQFFVGSEAEFRNNAGPPGIKKTGRIAQ